MGSSCERSGHTHQQIVVKEPNVEDIKEISEHLRKEDIRECADVGGMHPSEALLESWAVSKDNCFAASHQDRGWICIWGCSPTGALGVGSPWLLGTPEIENVPLTFLRESKRWIAETHKEYPIMTNIADERNEIHLKWLRWLGFKFVNRYEEFGPGKVSVIQFAKVSPCAFLSL